MPATGPRLRGAMAGGMWGARRGAAALPAEPLGRLEAREEIAGAARALAAARPVATGTPGA